MQPTRRHPFAALLAGIAFASVACGSEPKVDVQVGQSPPPPAAANAPAAQPAEAAAPQRTAPPIAPGTPMPAHHPPIGDQASSQPAMPPGHPPMGGSAPPNMQVRPVDPNLGTGGKGLAWTAPASWISVPPSSSMRRAQYRVPGPAGDAECAVFYFGPGEGGEPLANAERWAGQFAQPGGKPPLAVMKTRSFDVGGSKVLIVETSGTYLAGSMTGGAVQELAGYALLGAIVEGPDANWFFKLTGPAATVQAQRDAFEAMLKSLKRGG